MNLKVVNHLLVWGVITLTNLAVADSRGEIRFNEGSPTRLTGMVTQENSHEYTLTAKAGQPLKVEMVGGRNAVFALYQLANKNRKILEDNATHWKGKLPTEGNYLIVIKSVIGDSDYDLRVTLQ